MGNADFVLVAAGATRGLRHGRAAVGLVAPEAIAVTRGRRRPLVAMAARARWSGVRLVGVGPVARATILVPPALPCPSCLAHVARRAESEARRWRRRRIEAVGAVAVLASRAAAVNRVVALCDRRVATRARTRRAVWLVRMRGMARDARGVAAVRSADLGVATGARRGRGAWGVRLVARRANAMRGRGRRHQCRLFAMAARAYVGIRGEFMRAMARRARSVAGGLRATRRIGRVRAVVTAGARLEGGERRSVRPVAVDARGGSFVPPVTRRDVAVADAAVGLHGERSVVRSVAARAVGCRVRAGGRGNCGERPARLGVALDTCGRLRLRCKRVAREAVRLRRVVSSMKLRRFAGVAAGTRVRGRLGERARTVVVAVLARDAGSPHVLDVPEARAVRSPRRGDRRRGAEGGALGAHPERHERRDRKAHDDAESGDRATPAGHGPVPWQSRHGASCVLIFVLTKPGPCGFPPGPPTL